ncbi:MULTISPECIES: hypothetical protein [unclassified Coleofasciculus]|uniref:hypothetical protein n=1 Tax=unclassified Coleofasciculus TaxID=2692782 RepID=UPI0018800FE3|nr:MULTISPECIES: hypothetical protein [unclassified Coleofasciculus]MBE9125507.1 hypothetical protein [Coleofasciculus sp. LEGE 07081]MBE9148629.1 hypothetical protein [Coleofasciculus sp. LEGE 07092]
MNKQQLRNVLVGTGIAAVGGIGTKLAVDYFRNRDKEEVVDETQEDAQPTSTAEVAYATVQTDSVQGFLDSSFGEAGRYVPNRPPKVFEYQGEQYMVIWARDNKQNKNQMLAFLYAPEGRKMIASVGYTSEKTDYNINLENTPLAVEVNGNQIRSGQSETEGTNEVDLVPVDA